MAPATTPGTVLGTVGYMSPEQVRGEPSRSTLRHLRAGRVLYEMLTGQRAYKRDTAAETMSAILREDPPDPPTLNVTVPPAYCGRCAAVWRNGRKNGSSRHATSPSRWNPRSTAAACPVVSRCPLCAVGVGFWAPLPA